MIFGKFNPATTVDMDMRGNTDLRKLPVGTLIITVGPTIDVTHKDYQYLKFNDGWRSPDGTTYDDEALATSLTEQIAAHRKAIATYVPYY